MNKELLLKRIQDLSGKIEPIPTLENPRLKTLGEVHCVVFDFYGTMFISGVGDIGIEEEPDAESQNLFEEALRNTGIDIESEAGEKGLQLFSDDIEKYKENHRSDEIDYPEPDIVMIWYEVLEQLREQQKIRGTLNRETARRFAVEFEFRFNPVWPMPDLESTLKQLREKRYILGIISNSQFYTPLAFEALTSGDLTSAGFDTDLLVWSYRASVKKPSLHFYRRFVNVLNRKHKMQPQQVLYVGNDVLKDIMPASQLGMKTALFAGDERSLKWRADNPQCSGVTPDLVITELSQLIDCLPS